MSYHAGPWREVQEHLEDPVWVKGYVESPDRPASYVWVGNRTYRKFTLWGDAHDGSWFVAECIDRVTHIDTSGNMRFAPSEQEARWWAEYTGMNDYGPTVCFEKRLELAREQFAEAAVSERFV